MTKQIELWADSFHEGSWCCEHIARAARKRGWRVRKSYIRGFQPQYVLFKPGIRLELTVYGSYRSWSPLPAKIAELIQWGKPDFLAYDAQAEEILFAVEETAATPTGNQPMQRCERQYGGARFRIPYWYLISEYGRHIDGGTRRDSIWPTIAAIKLSIRQRVPCVVLHYSDIDNPEDYTIGSGVNLLFRSLFQILENHLLDRPPLDGLKPLLENQYREMLDFLLSQWGRIIDFLPSAAMVGDPNTAKVLAEIVTGDSSNAGQIRRLLEWPLIRDVPPHVRAQWTAKKLLKYDPLCARMERDISEGRAYYLSDNAGSGRPPSIEQVRSWVKAQAALFQGAAPLTPPAQFSLRPEDFPETGEDTGNCHLTTAKNIVYLYDSWNAFVDSVTEVYPRLRPHLSRLAEDMPLFVYVCNSLKPGRLFGDPYTGQLAAYSTAFGKFDPSPRRVVAYFPHQVHTQALSRGRNKGRTLMGELTDYLIFHGGVAVKQNTREVL